MVATASLTYRLSLTTRFLVSAQLFARRALELESKQPLLDVETMEHSGLVVAAVMQSGAAIESELAEILEHGVPHHLGSNADGTATRDFLQPFVETIERTSGSLERWDLTLHVLRKPKMNKGAWPYQDALQLMNLRNALVHYRSRFGGDDGRKVDQVVKLFKERKFPSPPFLGQGGNDFPDRLLSWRCARWAGVIATAFIDAAYGQMAVPSVLDLWRAPGAPGRSFCLQPSKTVVPPTITSKRRGAGIFDLLREVGIPKNLSPGAI